MKKGEKTAVFYARITPENKKFISNLIKKKKLSISNFMSELINKIRNKELDV